MNPALTYEDLIFATNNTAQFSIGFIVRYGETSRMIPTPWCIIWTGGGKSWLYLPVSQHPLGCCHATHISYPLGGSPQKLYCPVGLIYRSVIMHYYAGPERTTLDQRSLTYVHPDHARLRRNSP
ncbi:hypothetical protein M8818_003839 [Zalaria obscura]|uniref:Uncharacterized protein n=1 Tax=Zalaria obscura TaxID=2024903 RepID=A0ACC3SDK1_9PEZI